MPPVPPSQCRAVRSGSLGSYPGLYPDLGTARFAPGPDFTKAGIPVLAASEITMLGMTPSQVRILPLLPVSRDRRLGHVPGGPLEWKIQPQGVTYRDWRASRIDDASLS